MIHLLGGFYGADNAQTTGVAAIFHLAAFRADRAIQTVAAIDAERGAMDTEAYEVGLAEICKHALTNSVTVAWFGSYFAKTAS